MSVEPDGTPVVVPCSKCATSTHHSVLHQVGRSGSEDWDYDWADDYQIIECQGCKTVSFRIVHVDSEDYDSHPDGPLPFVKQELYPAREEGRRELLDAVFVPFEIRRIYEETRSAIANDQRVLAGIGVRAIVESVCREMDAQGGSLKLKIDDLARRGLLTPDGAAILQQLRTMGNSSAHSVQPHPADQLALAMDVVEHLLQGAFIFPERARWTLDREV